MTRRRLAVVALFAAASWLGASTVRAPAGAAADAPLVRKLSRALAAAHVPAHRSAALAVDLETGETLFSHNPGLALAPASTEKLAVSYALLVRLGPSYRIRTQVTGSGRFAAGTWHGDLVLEGRGDPTLTRGGLRTLARQLRRAGIRRVTGAVIGDESYFDARRTAPGWKSWFYVNECAPISALLVDGGLHRGYPTRYPAHAAAIALHDELHTAGVRVRKRPIVAARDAPTELAAVLSAPLAVVLRRVNSDSDNTAAELLLKHLGAAQAGRGTTEAGAALVRRTLAETGVPTTGIRLADGSGLSRLDRLTAGTLVRILTTAWASPPLRRALVGSLAVTGRRGTLEDRLTRGPAAGRVYGKTGTTAIASALTGYVRGRYVFAVLQNGPPLSTWSARRAQDRFVSVLARAQ